MRIKSINWLDEDIKEALIEITDGKRTFWCFSDGNNVEIGAEIKEGELEIIELENVLKSSKAIFKIEETTIPLAYYVVGRLMANRRSLKIGKILLNIENCYIPGDLCDGDVIEATAIRIDLA